ncbi:hypothetical protein QVD17_28428 [Tagetes erecta]|uniref:Uncharacterized protein n=1 Tax=Tagetes erecta TaxID=13708 RepID=A0AAD8KAM9_TARER|nr:hypothetical protein QVD17_28428 [Tagetes erecta]
MCFFFNGTICSVFPPVMLQHVCFKCYIMSMIYFSNGLFMDVVVIQIIESACLLWKSVSLHIQSNVVED